MAGLEIVLFSLYIYILGRALSDAGQEVIAEKEACKEKWKKAKKEVNQEMLNYMEKRRIEKRLEKEQGLEMAGTLNGGVAASSTPQEAPGTSCEESPRTPAKKGNAKKLMSKLTSVFPFKSKND